MGVVNMGVVTGQYTNLLRVGFYSMYRGMQSRVITV